jgi:hypothetical protein
MLSTAFIAQSRNHSFTISIKHDPLLSLPDLRIAAMDPGVFAAASDFAKRYFPRTSLARAA